MLRQNWIASSLNVWLRPRLPLGWPCLSIVGSSQISSELREFNASLYVFQLVVRYFCGTGFIPFRLPDLRVLRWQSLIYATKPWSLYKTRGDSNAYDDVFVSGSKLDWHVLF